MERSAKMQIDATERSAKRRKKSDDKFPSSAVANNSLRTPENCRCHPGFLYGVCLGCCQQAEKERSSVDFRYLLPGLRLTSWGIFHMREANTARLLQEKKLVLILDLDHTLLHSIHIDQEAYGEDEGEEEPLRIKASNPDAGLFRLDGIATWTKLRPFVRDFLRGASTMFDMYLYTMGTRSYAVQMAELLDPKGEYFMSKIIAREDSTVPHRKGLDVVLAEESLVLILDDTSHVWEGHGENLIVVPKYNFFGHNNSMSSETTTKILEDEKESDGLLATALDLLKLIHQLFYDPDFKTELATQDVREVLRNISQAASGRSVQEPKPAITKQPIARSSTYAA